MYVLNPPGLGFLTQDEEMQFLLCLIIFVTRPILQPLPPLLLRRDVGHTLDTWGLPCVPGRPALPCTGATPPRSLRRKSWHSGAFFPSPPRLPKCPGSSRLLSLLRHVAGFLKTPVGTSDGTLVNQWPLGEQRHPVRGYDASVRW